MLEGKGKKEKATRKATHTGRPRGSWCVDGRAEPESARSITRKDFSSSNIDVIFHYPGVGGHIPTDGLAPDIAPTCWHTRNLPVTNFGKGKRR